MNRRLSKKINQKTIDIFIDWLGSVMSAEEASKIEKSKYKEYVPNNAYYYAHGSLKNSLFTPRWIKRKLKRMYKANPSKRIQDYALSDFK